ncbi:hypothetical protein ACNKHT_09840 [Shigella flexneri]
MTTMNPFLVQSTLPNLAPHFDQIANYYYRPAFDEGMQQKQKLLPSRLTRGTPYFNKDHSGTGTKWRITYPLPVFFCDDGGVYQ